MSSPPSPSIDVQPLLDKVRQYLPEEKLGLVEQAYQFASRAHAGQFRRSALPFIEHPLETAIIVAELQLDAASVAGALLHDVMEDAGVTREDLEARFGAEIARLVDGTSRLTRISRRATQDGPEAKKRTEDSQSRAESLRKMLVATADDVRVVLIKLADRLHNMRTLRALPRPRRLAISQETMDIYAPLAHRLGISQLQWELEDLAFRYLSPIKYREVARLVDTRRTTREQYIARVTDILSQELEKAEIGAELTGRPKHIYSIYTKMEKYAAQGKEFSDIYDLLALRILVDGVKDCYAALGVVHSLWHPLPGQFDDYIANPKENMYQSLHTTVMCLDAKPLEVQIRTHEMHRVAEYGIAAHWRYKEGTKKDARFEEKMAWLRQLMEWQRELSTTDFVESLKSDIFPDQVFVYTPKGDIKDLPRGATPLDFAYRIHTDLGHRCIGAKVNGRLVPLDYELENGDTVEILTTKVDRGPSRDWLNPNLGYIKTTSAREKVRQWFRKQERADNIARGKELLDKELRRLGVALGSQERIASLFDYDDVDDFLAAIGCGDINPHQIALKLAGQPQRPRVAPEVAARPQPPSSLVQVLGVGDLLTHLALCCHPVPGDDIIGYITRSRGVSVHRKDCPNIINEDEPQRLVKVDWGQSNELHQVSVAVEAWDRVGLLRDLSAVVSADRINIAAVNLQEHDGDSVTIYLTVSVNDLGQLSRLLTKLEGVRGVFSANRVDALPKGL